MKYMIKQDYRYVLETQVPNTYVRHELRKNMGNLPMRFKSIAISNNLVDLLKIKGLNDKIIDKKTGKIIW